MEVVEFSSILWDLCRLALSCWHWKVCAATRVGNEGGIVECLFAICNIVSTIFIGNTIYSAQVTIVRKNDPTIKLDSKNIPSM